MGPRGVERPGRVAGGSSSRDGGALGKDMTRTRKLTRNGAAMIGGFRRNRVSGTNVAIDSHQIVHTSIR